MDIRFVSTLTADDERQFAPALLRAVSSLLDTTPIAYTLRIETLDGEVLQHTHPSSASDASAPDRRGARPVPLRRVENV